MSALLHRDNLLHLRLTGGKGERSIKGSAGRQRFFGVFFCLYRNKSRPSEDQKVLNLSLRQIRNVLQGH